MSGTEIGSVRGTILSIVLSFAVLGWCLFAVLALGITRWRLSPSQLEAQLQQITREYAAAKYRWLTERGEASRAHDAQMDAIRSVIVQYELEHPDADPALRRLFDDLLSRTKKRGERA